MTEQRDEINTKVTQEWDDFSLSGTYRYSHEYDYQSHGGTLSGSYAMAEKSTTLDFRIGEEDDDRRITLRAGDVYLAGVNIWHGDSNFIGDDELGEVWILDVFAPPRIGQPRQVPGS